MSKFVKKGGKAALVKADGEVRRSQAIRTDGPGSLMDLVNRAALVGEDDPATWTQAGSWLEAFCHDAQTVLLAELELRLKPVVGLIAALGDTAEIKETKPQ